MNETISISPVTFDLEGPLLLRPAAGSDIHRVERRLSRSATLDGGVAIYDGGFTDGDRTLQITHRNPTSVLVDRAIALCKNHTEVTISARDGCYSGVVEVADYVNGDLIVTALIRSRLDT